VILETLQLSLGQASAIQYLQNHNYHVQLSAHYTEPPNLSGITTMLFFGLGGLLYGT
jgi:hypothetical protein